MHDRVLGAANVAVHRHPIVDRFGAPCLLVVLWIAESEKVPRGARKAAHRVGFSLCEPTVAIDAVDKLLDVGQRRGAVTRRLIVVHVRKLNWQRIYRHEFFVSILGMNDRDGATPIPLTRDQPVAKLVLDFAVTNSVGFEPHSEILLGICDCLAIVVARIDQSSLLWLKCLPFGVEILYFIQSTLSNNYWNDFQPKFLGEVKIPLIVARNRHDSAGSVRC